jgi:RNA polymerase sigma factor (sigma-70 family)
VERYAPLILSIPRRYGLRAAQADDVFADVCLALVRALSGLRDPKALPQWLIRTTTRATWEAARKAKVQPPDDLPPLTGAAPPEEVMSRWEEEQLVRDALAALPERCRKLLTLLYFRAPAPSYDEVAEEMGMPRGSLGPTRSRCLARMRRHLEPKLDWDVSGGDDDPPRS